MKQLKIDLEHCYGIKELKLAVEFGATGAVVLYAPNGVMKTSLARTFTDLQTNQPSKDVLFPSRVTRRSITDDAGAAVESQRVFVIHPYDERFGHTERTSTLLVNSSVKSTRSCMQTWSRLRRPSSKR